MKTIVVAKRTLGALAVTFAAPLLLAPAQASDRLPATREPGADTATEAGIASGAVEDSLQACMARIPHDASIGQRMIAEQSCWRDENDRKPIQDVPGAHRI